jgi:hypothetical protein
MQTYPGNLKELATTGARIPILLEQCIGIIETRGLRCQGIYRLSGNAATITRIRGEINKGNFAELVEDGMDVNVVSGLLKCTLLSFLQLTTVFLRELTDPVIPFSYYDRFVAAMRKPELWLSV